MPYCKYCGSAIDCDAIFCTECGKKLVNTAPVKKEVPPKVSNPQNELIRGGAFTAEQLLPQYKAEQIKEYMGRVERYRRAMVIMNEFYNRQADWSEYDLKLWLDMEATMRKKYDIPENSIYRMIEPTRYEKPAEKHRQFRSYEKKNPEYWQKFEKEPKEE